MLVGAGSVEEDTPNGTASDDVETTGIEASDEIVPGKTNEVADTPDDDQASTTADASDAEHEPRIVVSDWIYPGAIVAIGDSVTHVDAKLPRCVLKEENGTIRTFSL